MHMMFLVAVAKKKPAATVKSANEAIDRLFGATRPNFFYQRLLFSAVLLYFMASLG